MAHTLLATKQKHIGHKNENSIDLHFFNKSSYFKLLCTRFSMSLRSACMRYTRNPLVACANGLVRAKVSCTQKNCINKLMD